MEESVPLYEIVLTKSQLFGKDTWNRGWLNGSYAVGVTVDVPWDLQRILTQL